VPNVSERAIREYSEIFMQTGAYAWMKNLESLDEQALSLSFMEGRLVDE